MNISQGVQLFTCGVSFILALFACAKACKVNINKEFPRDEQGSPLDENGKPIEGEIGILDSLNPLGFGIGATIIASFLTSKDMYEDVYSTTDFIMTTILFGVMEVIFFVICFYIVYGIMSAANSNPETRRNTAGWVTIALNLLLTYFAVQQGF